MYINSQAANYAVCIYDTMKDDPDKISTVAVVLRHHSERFIGAGAKGQRFALPNATIHFTPTSGGDKGRRQI